jgi:hypothetical protein
VFFTITKTIKVQDALSPKLEPLQLLGVVDYIRVHTRTALGLASQYTTGSGSHSARGYSGTTTLVRVEVTGQRHVVDLHGADDFFFRAAVPLPATTSPS